MPEIDIDKTIEKHWQNFRRQLNDEDAEILDKILEDIEEHFNNPTQDNPVKTVDFVRWLDPEPIIDVLKPSFPYFEYIRPRLIPRMRFFAYFMISRKKNAWQAYHSLGEEEYVKLGFEEKPTYELIREFCYERIGVDEFSVVLHWVVKEIGFLLRKQGISLGEYVFEDATDIRSLKDDPDAKYSGYYKHRGYKVDKTIDTESCIPLDYKPMEITANEGENLILSQKTVLALGLNEKTRVIDCKYAILKNIAHSELNGISLYYKITKNWNYKEEGSPREIKKLYQKYHFESDFNPNADMDFMLNYLFKKEEFEAVGAYYRNQRMKQAENDPKGYKKICGKRGTHMEGHIGRVKLTTLLGDHPGRRGWKQFPLRVGMTMLSLVFVALIRVQNDVLDHLSNVTYIV